MHKQACALAGPALRSTRSRVALDGSKIAKRQRAALSSTAYRSNTSQQQDQHSSSSSSQQSAFNSSQSHSKGKGRDDGESSSQQQRQREKEAEPELTPGTSPFAIFVRVIREELEKNRQYNENIKQLGGRVDDMQDSKAWAAMRKTYEQARLRASIQENPRLRKAAADLAAAGGKVNDAIAEAVTQSMIYRGLSRGAAAAYAASEPIRQTEVYKAVASSVDDILKDVKYGGFVEKDARRQRRQLRLQQIGKSGGLARKPRPPKMEANEQAGENIVLHETANARPSEPESLAARILPKPVAQFLSSVNESYQTSENPFIHTMRTVTNTIGRVFDETETARVITRFKELDPEFQQESFLNELREYIVPEIVDALVSADLKTLRQWLSEAPLAVVSQGLNPTLAQGLVSDSRVLDIRAVDLVKAQVLENDIPVFVISFHTQEMHCFRDPKTGEVKLGADDRVASCGYVAVLTRLEDELDNPETGGWKIIDMARREQR